MPSNCENFLSVCSEYKLGELPTEHPHPLTKNLSELAKTKVAQAIELLREVDYLALKKLEENWGSLDQLHLEIKQTLKDKRRVILVGCGATGRLSLALESWWRSQNPGNNQVIGIMAAGDLALIHSIESAEDYPEYGKRHLIELGIEKEDLVIGITEGGETPYVLGAVEYAAITQKRKPYLLYCNPDNILKKIVKRSKSAIENPKVNNIALPVGPMALSGSTRMQACDVLQIAVGAGLIGGKTILENTLKFIQKKCPKNFETLIQKESELYSIGKRVIYQTNPYLALTVLTDTTERSPTFGLRPFENQLDIWRIPSWSYLCIKGAKSNEIAWKKMLGRDPRALSWPEFKGAASLQRLYGFDLKESMLDDRKVYFPENMNHYLFSIESLGKNIQWVLDKEKIVFKNIGANGSLEQLMALKMMLNIHSTIVMGRAGRYEGNVMTWVKASNNKLIDRSIRYVSLILKNKSIPHTYEEVAKTLFKLMNRTSSLQSIVMETANAFRKKS